MKKFLKIFSLFLLINILCLTQFSLSAGASTIESSITRDYFSDGSYIETEIIQSQNVKSTITGATKRSTFKNASGQSLWYGEITANFYYNGSSASCTYSSASARSLNSLWKIKSINSSRSGNTATGKIVASSYSAGGTFIADRLLTVDLSCDKNGNLF